jgi:predicted TPR repeat methyltransferase
MNEIYESEVAFSKALHYDPLDTTCLFNLALIKLRQNLMPNCIDLLEECVRLDTNHEQAPFLLAALKPDSIMIHAEKKSFSSAPVSYVKSLFDFYASNGYTQHMLNELNYTGHSIVCDALSDVLRTMDSDSLLRLESTRIADLGCGSGLVGKALRENGYSGYLLGCDLSQNMINEAAQITYDDSTVKPVYNGVAISDCSDFLSQFVLGEERFNYILAADVVCYFGDLLNLFASISSALMPDGIFVFTTETMMDDFNATKAYELQRSARYAHDALYVEETASSNQMSIIFSRKVTLRNDGGILVNGIVYAAKKTGN